MTEHDPIKRWPPENPPTLVDWLTVMALVAVLATVLCMWIEGYHR